MTQLSDFAPPTISAQAARLQSRQRFFNLVVTNVPGPQFPLYLMGRRMERLFPMVPLAKRQALCVGIMSYDGQVNFGLIGDYDAMAELEDFAGDLDAALDELIDAGGGRRGLLRRFVPGSEREQAAARVNGHAEDAGLEDPATPPTPSADPPPRRRSDARRWPHPPGLRPGTRTPRGGWPGHALAPDRLVEALADAGAQQLVQVLAAGEVVLRARVGVGVAGVGHPLGHARAAAPAARRGSAGSELRVRPISRSGVVDPALLQPLAVVGADRAHGMP